MYTKRMLNTVCACMLGATMAAGYPASSWFEAHTTGAKVLTLRGSAEFGRVPGEKQPGVFVLTLGAKSSMGAVVFTLANGRDLVDGVYKLSEEAAEEIQALVVTGSPTRPTGAYRARTGTLTITRSGDDSIEGAFDFVAVGFDATDQENETRELQVHGTFAASPSAPQGAPGDVAVRREALVAK